MDAKNLREKANKLATDMQALTTKVIAEQRELNNEERAQFDAMDKDRDVLLADEARLLKVERLNSGEGRVITPSQPAEYRGQSGESRGKVTNQDRMNVLRGWMMPSDQRSNEMRQSAQRMGVSLDGKQFTMSLSQSPLASLRPEEVRQWEERVIAGVTSPDGGGHFTIPDEGMRALEVALLRFGGMRQAVVAGTEPAGH